MSGLYNTGEHIPRRDALFLYNNGTLTSLDSFLAYQPAKRFFMVIVSPISHALPGFQPGTADVWPDIFLSREVSPVG